MHRAPGTSPARTVRAHGDFLLISGRAVRTARQSFTAMEAAFLLRSSLDDIAAAQDKGDLGIADETSGSVPLREVVQRIAGDAVAEVFAGRILEDRYAPPPPAGPDSQPHRLEACLRDLLAANGGGPTA